MKPNHTAACLLAAAALAACDSQADKIGNASTVFNLLGKTTASKSKASTTKTCRG